MENLQGDPGHIQVKFSYNDIYGGSESASPSLSDPSLPLPLEIAAKVEKKMGAGRLMCRSVI